MPHVKRSNRILRQFLEIKPHFLTIGGGTTFAQTFQKIKRSKNADFVWVKKPKIGQMLAVLAARLTGQKFLWIQGFDNPPSPNFWSRFLTNQADKVIVKTKQEAAKLKKLGITRSKIKYHH